MFLYRIMSENEYNNLLKGEKPEKEVLLHNPRHGRKRGCFYRYSGYLDEDYIHFFKFAESAVAYKEEGIIVKFDIPEEIIHKLDFGKGLYDFRNPFSTDEECKSTKEQDNDGNTFDLTEGYSGVGTEKSFFPEIAVPLDMYNPSWAVESLRLPEVREKKVKKQDFLAYGEKETWEEFIERQERITKRIAILPPTWRNTVEWEEMLRKQHDNYDRDLRKIFARI